MFTFPSFKVLLMILHQCPVRMSVCVDLVTALSVWLETKTLE